MSQTKLIRSAAGADGLTPNDAVSRVFLAPDDSVQKFSNGKMDFTNGSSSAVPDATNRPAYIGDSMFNLPLKIHKSGAAEKAEYLVTARNASTGALTLDRNYEEATSPAGGDAYVMARPLSVKKYLVVNKDSAVAVNVFPINPDGTISAERIKVDAGGTYNSEPTDVLGVQYVGGAGFGAGLLEVYFYDFV